MMRFSKKAEFSFLLAIIGVVIVAIPLIAVSYKLAVGSEKYNDEQKCKLSIFAAAQASKLKKSTADTLDLVPNLACNKKEILVKPDYAKRSRGGRIDADVLKQKVLDEMYRCYNMVGGLELDPFDSAMPKTSKTYCLICAQFKFDKSFIEEAEKSNVQFKNFLYYSDIKKPTGSTQTMASLMYSSPPTTEEIVRAKELDEEYLFSVPWVIVWRIERTDNKWQILPIPPNIKVAGIAKDLLTGKMKSISEIGRVKVYQGLGLEYYSDLAGSYTSNDYTRPYCTVMLN
jgi:hypothetical protein